MRVSSRTIVTSVVACALAIGWVGASGASARPASEPPAARHIVVFHDDVDPDAAAREHGRRHGAQVEQACLPQRPEGLRRHLQGNRRRRRRP